MLPRRARHAPLALLLAVATGAAAWAHTSARVSGPDEGIYVATASSIAGAFEYTQPFLPRPLPQTKYPPFYPLLLAGAGGATSFQPSDLRVLKSVNAIALAAITLLTMALVRDERAGAAWMIAAGALAGTAPALVSFVDVIATELVFTALLVAMLVAIDDDPSTPHVVVAAILASLALLTRLVGVALGIALIWHLARTRGWRGALPAVLVVGSTLAGWMAWRQAAFPDSGLLEAYYLSYETSAWQMMTSRPAEALDILWANAHVYPALAPMVFGWPMAWLSAVACATAVLGISRMGGARRGLMLRCAVAYAIPLLGHPYPIDRYLIPTIPLIVAGIVVAAARAKQGSLRWAALALTCLLAASQALWTVRYIRMPDTQIHAAFGRPLNFEWEGFAEAMAWLGRHADEEAVVAAFRESIVYLYTGRHSIRLSLHLPETWSWRDGRHIRPEEVSTLVAREYDRLGVDLVMVSPPLRDVEGMFAEEVLRHLGVADAPAVFVSRDGLHRIYRRRDLAGGR